jgi:hypothetical protein
MLAAASRILPKRASSSQLVRIRGVCHTTKAAGLPSSAEFRGPHLTHKVASFSARPPLCCWTPDSGISHLSAITVVGGKVERSRKVRFGKETVSVLPLPPLPRGGLPIEPSGSNRCRAQVKDLLRGTPSNPTHLSWKPCTAHVVLALFRLPLSGCGFTASCATRRAAGPC